MSRFNTLEFLISMDSFGYEMLPLRLVKLHCSVLDTRSPKG